MMKFSTRNIAMIAVLFALSLAVACGGGDKQQTQQQPGEVEQPATPESKKVVLYQYRFNPNSLAVPAGTTVVFENKDPERHNVRIAALNIDQMLEPGGTWSYTFNTTGEFAVDNRLATNPMNMTITVE